jgi:hypothetical protein
MYTTDGTSGTRTAYLSGAHELIPVVIWVWVLWTVVCHCRFSVVCYIIFLRFTASDIPFGIFKSSFFSAMSNDGSNLLNISHHRGEIL